jgi:hypothetical protein
MNIIDRVVRGEVRLWKVYWLGYFIPAILLMFLLLALREMGNASPWWLGWPLQTVVLFYTLWISVGMWACAPNVNTRVFFWLGRIGAVISFLNILMSLLKMLQR